MTRRREVAALLAIVMIALSPLAAIAQRSSPAGFGAIEGYVIDLNDRELVGVEVFLLDAPTHKIRTFSAGAYRLDSISPGPHMLHFRRLGATPLEVPVTIRPNELTSVDVRMEMLPVSLTSVTVETSRGEFLHMPRDLMQRIKTGLGHYLTSDDIDRRNVIRTNELLTRIPGISFTSSGHPYRARGETSLMAMEPTPAKPSNKRKIASGCDEGMTVYIDGAPIRIADSTSTPLDLVRPGELMAIEVYKSSIEMPATLPESPCGAVFLWTKQ